MISSGYPRVYNHADKQAPTTGDQTGGTSTTQLGNHGQDTNGTGTHTPSVNPVIYRLCPIGAIYALSFRSLLLLLATHFFIKNKKARHHGQVTFKRSGTVSGSTDARELLLPLLSAGKPSMPRQQLWISRCTKSNKPVTNRFKIPGTTLTDRRKPVQGA